MKCMNMIMKDMNDQDDYQEETNLIDDDQDDQFEDQSFSTPSGTIPKTYKLQNRMN